MVLLFLFSQLVTAKGRSTQLAGSVLLWAVLIFFVTFLVFTVTAFASEWPPAWAAFLGIANAEASALPKPADSHHKIPGGTGWVFLGYYNSETGAFTEGPKAEIVTSSVKRASRYFNVGETIRLKVASKVRIVDYRITKTDKNLMAPTNKPSGAMTIDDDTGVLLPVGTVLILREVARGRSPGNPNGAIWGRVVYADEN